MGDVTNHVQQLYREHNFLQADPEMSKLVQRETESLFYVGKPVLAAATHLSINDYKSCVQTLVRAQELFLAFMIARFKF